MTTSVKIRSYTGEEKEAALIAISAEMDFFGNVNYKTEMITDEGRNISISYIYDIEEAISEFDKLARKILTEQTERLKEKGIGSNE